MTNAELEQRRLDLGPVVTSDRGLKLVTVLCPSCGITAGVLPGSKTWHCHKAMVPVDPGSASRLTRNARQKRWDRGSQTSRNTAQNPGYTGGLEG